jgi:tRNA A-37 threonylcarbamoyl transferase component Bud32
MSNPTNGTDPTANTAETLSHPRVTGAASPETHDTVTAGSALPPRTAVMPERIGDYRVLRKIGEGGMGSVYLAEDVRLGRKAAIKTMRPHIAADPDDRNRFIREARAAAAVEHDNIVPVWQVGEAADGTPFIVMPFLQGEMLDSRLNREPVSPVWLIVEVGRDTAEGLAAAHAHGLIHRDIKPSNVWLEGDPANPDPTKKVRRAKLLDFGLARSVSSDETQLTASGVVLGTPAYMSPEQARGTDLDARSDLWSLGAMLYRMATGRQPFEGTTTMAVLCALIADTPPPVRTLNPTIPPALALLIDQLLQKDRAARPAAAAEVANRLRQLASTIDRDAAQLPPVLATPAAAAGTWADAIGGRTEPDDLGALHLAEPLAEEIEYRPNARPAPAPPAARPVPRPQPAPRSVVPGEVPAALRTRTVPLPLALLMLLVIGAAGVYLFRSDIFPPSRPDPDKPTPENKSDIKFSKPDSKVP